jgi:hypothetical protein
VKTQLHFGALAVGALLMAGVARAQTDAPPELLKAVQAHAEKAGVPLVARWRHALTDLNGDRVDDAVVLMTDPAWCGTGGCRLVVFKGSRRGFTLQSQSSVSDVPIRVSPIVVAGWKSLIVHSRGRGAVLLRFSGTRYPDNPSLQPKASAGQLRAASLLIE